MQRMSFALITCAPLACRFNQTAAEQGFPGLAMDCVGKGCGEAAGNLAAQEEALGVEGEGHVPVALGRVFRGSIPVQAGIVDSDVQAPQLLHNCVYHPAPYTTARLSPHSFAHPNHRLTAPSPVHPSVPGNTTEDQCKPALASCRDLHVLVFGLQGWPEPARKTSRMHSRQRRARTAGSPLPG